jgi:hypothetical protein
MSAKAERRQFTAEELKKWTEVVAIDSVKPHPRNPNNGDQERINESIEAHGQFRTVVLSQDDYLLAGNHTYAGAMEKGKKTLGVIRLPLMHDHPQAIEIMLADNHIGRKGKDDKGILEELLMEVKESQGNLLGAGFQDDELDRLLAENEAASDAALSANLEYKVIIDCTSEEHQAQLLERFEAEGLKCKALIA